MAPPRDPFVGRLTVTSAVALSLAAGCGGRNAPVDSASLPLDQIRLPPGFAISVYADQVPDARQLALGRDGTVFAGSMEAGGVYAVVDLDGDHRGEHVTAIASDLRLPSGVAYHDGSLYVAAVSRILRYDAIESRLDDPPRPVIVTDALPTEWHHGWKFLAVGPDGWLYVPVGAPCNVCDERDNDPRFASILRMRPDGTSAEAVAIGVRNTVGFDFHPETGRLWFTDNGRDLMGDDVPPDELNQLTMPGQDFGFPFCHGGDIPDPEFGELRPCSDFEPPMRRLDPHVAAVGMRFYTGSMFPPEFRGQIFIAEHGSWNRSVPSGYRVTLVRLENGRAASYEAFAEGWLQGGEAWGRPADILVMPDGALLVSDDKAGVIYRISYSG